MLKRLLLSLGLAACTTSGSTSTGIAQLSCAADSTLTYDNFGADFITSNCLSCHGGKDRPTLSTQAAVQTYSSQILQAAVYTNTMPKNNDISDAERQMLGEWLACGAP